MKRTVTMAAKHMTSAAIWRPKVAPRALGTEQYAVELKIKAIKNTLTKK